MRIGTFIATCYAFFAVSPAVASPIVIELVKGVIYGIGTSAGKEIYERIRGPSSLPERPPSPESDIDPSQGRPSEPQRTPPNALVLRIQNLSGENVSMQFYSPARPRGSWPGLQRAYFFQNEDNGVIRLNCVPKEKICFGGWARNKFWGTGFRLRYACQNCCRLCGSAARGVTLR